MTAMKKPLVYLLVLTVVLSSAVCGVVYAFADELKPITTEPSDIDNQLNFLYSQLDTLKQNDGQNPWYYTVTDLDHNGSLEFIAASQHPQDRSTNLKVWEVGADRKSLVECTLSKDPDESFPDILTDVADTFHDTASGTWNYLFYDNVVLSPTEVYTSKSAYHLKDGVIGYEPYAVEHTLVAGGTRSVSHTDVNGIVISPEQYNAAGVNAFAGAERSSTSFEWLTAAQLDSVTRLVDCYSVFTGQKAPAETFPVPRPEALQQQPAPTTQPAVPTPAPTLAPAPTPAPAPVQPVYLSITKNPTNENRTQGETAYFVSCANTYESLTWTFVSPNGGEYSVQSFARMYADAPVGGQNSTTLSIGNVAPDMSGWGTYCTFYYKGQTARTTTAYLYVSAPPQPKPAPSGSYSAVVTDYSYSTVSLLVENKVPVTLSQSICDIDGSLFIGASASVYWDGQNVTYCHITGDRPPVPPVYGSMSGTANEAGGGYAIDLSNGTQVYVDAWKCSVSGLFYDGAPCVVYYTDYPSSDNIYSVDITGREHYVGPVYGDMGGTAYSGGGGYAINLDNGTQVFADAWDCNVSGSFYEGAPCTVHYINYPSSDNIISVDIYGDSNPALYDGPGYTHGDTYTYELHEASNPDGSTYNTVTCPNCGREVSMAYGECPYCGFDLWN